MWRCCGLRSSHAARPAVTAARPVGVTTGGFTVADLTAAGASAVLPGLSDTAAVVASIVDGHAAGKTGEQT